MPIRYEVIPSLYTKLESTRESMVMPGHENDNHIKIDMHNINRKDRVKQNSRQGKRARAG